MAGLPIGSLIGDLHAALYGHAGFQSGAIKATYGTGSSLMTPTSTRIFSEKGLSSSIAWGYQQATYALEGNIYVTGPVQWLMKWGPAVNPVASPGDNRRRRFVLALAGLKRAVLKDTARV